MEKSRKGLYGILFERLEDLQKRSNRDIIPFPTLFKTICGDFSIKKEICWDVLFLLRDFGFVEIVAGHGVKIITDFSQSHSLSKSP